MGLFGQMADVKQRHPQYRNISEIPAHLLTQWLNEHCFCCGETIAKLERDWRSLNGDWADEATPDVLEYWQEKLHLSLEEVREAIRDGLLCDTPPVFSITSTIRTPLSTDNNSSYYVCHNCFERIFNKVFVLDTQKVLDTKTSAMLLAITQAIGIQIQAE